MCVGKSYGTSVLRSKTSIERVRSIDYHSVERRSVVIAIGRVSVVRQYPARVLRHRWRVHGVQAQIRHRSSTLGRGVRIRLHFDVDNR